MWLTMPISSNLFGFQPAHDKQDAWSATAIVKESVGGIEIHADVHLSYLKDKEQYELLLEAIRQLSESQKREKGPEDCIIYFRCRGVTAMRDICSVDSVPHVSGKFLVNSEFLERC